MIPKGEKSKSLVRPMAYLTLHKQQDAPDSGHFRLPVTLSTAPGCRLRLGERLQPRLRLSRLLVRRRQ